MNKSFGKATQPVVEEKPSKEDNNDHEKIDNTKKDIFKQVEASTVPTKDIDK